jgi:hypothetical protein
VVEAVVVEPSGERFERRRVQHRDLVAVRHRDALVTDRTALVHRLFHLVAAEPRAVVGRVDEAAAAVAAAGERERRTGDRFERARVVWVGALEAELGILDELQRLVHLRALERLHRVEELGRRGAHVRARRQRHDQARAPSCRVDRRPYDHVDHAPVDRLRRRAALAHRRVRRRVEIDRAERLAVREHPREVGNEIDGANGRWRTGAAVVDEHVVGDHEERRRRRIEHDALRRIERLDHAAHGERRRGDEGTRGRRREHGVFHRNLPRKKASELVRPSVPERRKPLASAARRRRVRV